MKIFKLTSVIALAFIFSINSLFAVGENLDASSKGEAIKVATAGGQFLKIPIGARAVGMGGAGGSITNDLSAIYWNPAGIADIKGVSTEFSYLQWFATYSHSFAALSFPLGNDFAVAVHAISFSSDNIQVTTTANPEGLSADYTVADLSTGLTLSGYLTDQFSFGITAKYVNNSIYNVSSNGFAFDIGTLYNTGIYGIKIAFSMHNLGTETSYEGQSLRTSKKPIDAADAAPVDMTMLAYPYSYPLVFRAGISSEVYKVDDHSVLVAADFTTFSDVSEQFSFGAEYKWSDLVALRAGYQFNQDEFGFAGGIGINYELGEVQGRFDYSINPTINLGLVNRFTIGVAF
jgi:hypothetical protein